MGAAGIKFNVGSDPDAIGDYTERLRRFDAAVPHGARFAVGECHFGTVAEDPRPWLGTCSTRWPTPTGWGPSSTYTPWPVTNGRNRWACSATGVRHVHAQLAEFPQATSVDELAETLRPDVAAIQAVSPEVTWTVEFSHGMWGFGRDDAEHDNPAYILQSARRDLNALRAALATA